MRVLSGLVGLRIRALYFTQSQRLSLGEVGLEEASNTGTGGPAYTVERCSCPPQYTGDSCEVSSLKSNRCRSVQAVCIFITSQSSWMAGISDRKSCTWKHSIPNFIWVSFQLKSMKAASSCCKLKKQNKKSTENEEEIQELSASLESWLMLKRSAWLLQYQQLQEHHFALEVFTLLHLAGLYLHTTRILHTLSDWEPCVVDTKYNLQLKPSKFLFCCILNGSDGFLTRCVCEITPTELGNVLESQVKSFFELKESVNTSN